MMVKVELQWVYIKGLNQGVSNSKASSHNTYARLVGSDETWNPVTLYGACGSLRKYSWVYSE